MGRLRKFRSLSRREKLLFCEACGVLLLSNLSVLVLPFRRIDRFLNAYWQDRTGDAFQPVDDVQNHIRLVKVSLLRAANVFPWKSLCLSRSIAAFVMLRRRGVAVVMFAGARLENSSLLAHAWIRAGHRIIDEKPQNSTFTALVQIGHEPVDAP